MAAQISGALPGRDYPPYVGDVGAVVGEIEAFLTGERHRPSLDRILSTALFTVKDLTAGSGLMFEDAGEYELKGVPGRCHLYRVLD